MGVVKQMVQQNFLTCQRHLTCPYLSLYTIIMSSARSMKILSYAVTRKALILYLSFFKHIIIMSSVIVFMKLAHDIIIAGTLLELDCT